MNLTQLFTATLSGKHTPSGIEYLVVGVVAVKTILIASVQFAKY